MSIAPVLLIIYKRDYTTQVVFDAIKKAKVPKLFIVANAPNPDKPDDKEKCDNTRKIVNHIDWDCEVTTFFRDDHLTVGYSVSDSINWFFERNAEGIILEDDCVPHPDFFTFASEMLDRYRDNKKIISINGSNLGYNLSDSHSFTFSSFMNMWGWATWRDRALHIDYQLNEWKSIPNKTWWIYNHAKQQLFDTDINWYRLWRDKFNKVAADPGFTWDWQWVYHQLKRNQLSIVPAVNLISNIGFDADATHTIEAANPAAFIPIGSMPARLVYPSEIQPDFNYEERFVKWVWCYHKRLPTMFYIKQFIFRMIGR
jgi:hypothetical protein